MPSIKCYATIQKLKGGIMHSNFGPSRLERIILCPGSVQMSSTVTEPIVSSYAQEGILLHQATDEAQNIGINEITYISEEQKSLVRECLDYKQSIITGLGHTDYTTAQEIQINLASWGIPEIWGTLDLAITDNLTRCVHIIDWKFGSGVMVSAWENPQLLAYAAGYVGWPTDIQEIVLHIYQPAIEHIDKFRLYIEDLRDWVHMVAAKAIALAQSKKPPLKPGIKQCRWCAVAATCRARYIQAQQDASRIFQLAQNLPKPITPNEIAELIKIAPRYEKYIKSLMTYAHQELEHGRPIPGFKLVRGKANRAWSKSETETALWLGKNTEIEDIYSSKIISPAQAEKLDKSLKKNSIFATLWDKPLGKSTLVPDSDPRPAIQPSSVATSVFAKVALEKNT